MRNERIEKTDYGYMLPSIIYDRLSEAFGSNIDHDEVYIDYTGGFRDISFLMTSVIRFLEFKGLKCGAIVYSEYRRKKIYDIHYIYDLYQLINGVSEFVATGNARELQEAYSRYNGNGQDSSIKLIEQLIDISDALSICDISNIEDKINRLIELLDEIDNTDIEQYKSRNEADIKPVILKSITSVIREKMHLDNKIDYPQMIQWCTENNMIQQALTLYTDKMPKYYFDHGFVPGYVVISEITPARGHDLYDTAFYTELYDRAAEGLEIKQLRAIIKSLTIYTDGRMDRNSIINEISKCGTNDQVIMKGIDELVKFIRDCYQLNGVDRVYNVNYPIYRILINQPENPRCDADGYIKVNDKIPEIFKEFWGQITSDKNYKWLHRFLYNNEKKYLAIAKLRKQEPDKTYRKKVYAIKRIMNGEIKWEGSNSSSVERTYKIMAYYLAVKMIRNKVNHAGEQRTYDETETIKTLNSLNIGINFKDDLLSYKQILMDGAKLSML